jgi:hypothetical protein
MRSPFSSSVLPSSKKEKLVKILRCRISPSLRHLLVLVVVIIPPVSLPTFHPVDILLVHDSLRGPDPRGVQLGEQLSDVRKDFGRRMVLGAVELEKRSRKTLRVRLGLGRQEGEGWNKTTYHLANAQALPRLLPALLLLRHLVIPFVCGTLLLHPLDRSKRGDLLSPEEPRPALEVGGLDVLLVFLSDPAQELNRERVLLQLEQETGKGQSSGEGRDERIACE